MADLTVFCPFTRSWAVEPFFAALGASDVPRDAFAGYVDSDDAGLSRAVREAACEAGFASVDVRLSGVAPLPPRARIATRQPRQAAMRETSKVLIGEGEVLLLEDDTLIPPDTFARLSESRRDYDWVVGAEVGRWGSLRPVGAWRVNGDSLDSMTPAEGVERTDATGLYCVLTSARTYRAMDFSFARLGPDLSATLRLSEAGKLLAVDWRVPCAHITQTRSFTIADAKPHSLVLE